MALIIRKAGKEDIDALSALLGKLFSIETDFVIDVAKQKAGLDLFLTDEDNRIILVAVFDAGIVGMATCQLVVSTAVGGYSILLEDMYVVGAFRHKGIGAMLIRSVRDWGEKKGALRIQLLMDERNRMADLFYKKMCFQGSHMTGFYKMLGS